MLWFKIAVCLSLGVLVLGIVLRVWQWWNASGDRGALLTVTWSLALWQAIAWPCMLFSGAWMVSENLAAGILLAGLLAGLSYAAWSIRVTGTALSSERATSAVTRFNSPLSDRGRSPMSSLAWFTLGVIVAICLIFAIIWIAGFFQGPVVGYNELGGPRFAKDQFFVKLGAGLAVLATGWVTALSLRRLKAPRPLTWGIIVVTTPLGIAFAFGM